MRRSFPAYVVVPQTRDRSANYINDTHGLRVSSRAPLADVLALVDELMRRHPIDPARVYALGFSMGASAAMDAAVARPGLFAAMVALSGVPPERSGACRGACADLADPRRLRSGECLCRRPGLGRGTGRRRRSAPVHHLCRHGPSRAAAVFTDGAWRQWLFEQRKPR